MPAICLTLAEDNLQSLNRKICSYSGKVGMVEVRLDFLSRPISPELPKNSATRFLATCRPVREGGHFSGAETDRIDLLHQAARRGFDWVDLEHDLEVDADQLAPASTVRSFHSFESSLPDLDSVLTTLRRRGGDVFKIAVSPPSSQDVINVLNWYEAQAERSRILAIGMGESAQLTRLLCPLLGSPWTYVAETGDRAVAAGQYSLQDFQDVYRVEDWTGKAPELYVEIGGSAPSCLIRLHNVLFKHYQEKKLYLPVMLPESRPWFQYLDSTSLPFRGMSIEGSLKWEIARSMGISGCPTGPVDTLCREGRDWIARNTDQPAFLRPLLRHFPEPAGKQAFVLGDGALAEGVVEALVGRRIGVVIAAEDPQRAKDLAQKRDCKWTTLERVSAADICVNTISGQTPDQVSPLQKKQIDFNLVYDLCCLTGQTRLIEIARENGAYCVPGMEMWIEKAALQFFSWTGIDPDRALIRSALEAEVKVE